MSTRQTSIDCFNQIKAEGLLSKRRLEVLEAIMKAAPCTSSEAIQHLKKSAFGIGSRFTELRDMGVIYEVMERPCNITGRNVIEWDLTDELPIAIKTSTNTKKHRIDNTLNALRELYRNKITSKDEDWKNVADLINSI